MADKFNSKDAEFIYASSYINSISGKGLGRELLSRMLESGNAAECAAYIADICPGADGNSDDICDKIINDSFNTVEGIIPQPEMFAFLRYPYDCANIKTAIKCAARGISDEGMLFDCGTLPKKAYNDMVVNGDYSPLPGKLAEAAAAAASAYKKTADPQQIDLPLDAACCASMAEAAERTDSEFITSTVALRIDIINILSALRIMRMNISTASDLLSRAFCPGGSITKEKIAAVADTDSGKTYETVITELLADAGYSGLAQKLDAGVTAGEAEKICDDFYLSRVYSAKNIPFGCEIPYIYLIGIEYDVKNARIILAGKRAGLDTDKIRERMRLSHV